MSIKVLMIGPSLDSQGGMASFARNVLDARGCGCPDDLLFDYYSTVAPGSRIEKLAFGLESYARFSSALSKADIVHVNFALGTSLPRKTAFAKAAKRRGKRIVLHSHSSALESVVRSENKIAKKKLDSFLSLADEVVVLTEHWKTLLAEAGVDSDRISIVPNGVRVPFENEVPSRGGRSSSEAARVLYLGRLEPEKGLDALADSMTILTKRGVRPELVLAGSGEAGYVARLEKRFATLPNPPRFAGWVDGEQKKDLIKRSDVFVLPSHREVLPIALLETMSYGVVPVVTRCGAMPEVVVHGSNGLLCEIGDGSSLADALETVCTDACMRENCSRAARATVAEKYSVENMFACLQTVYERVLA